MTVSSKVSSIIYSCDGVTTEFDVPFRFLEDQDLQLSIQNTDGIVTNLVLNSDYTVTGANADNGGKVHLTHPAPAQSKLSILRVVDLLQETDYRENERFPAESHERALDKLTMEVQQLQEQSDRSIKLDVFSDVEPDVLIGYVERIWDSVDNIDIIANDKANMDTVALNISDVNTTATNIADVSNVSNSIGNVNTVANISANVTTVANNISDVNAAVTNMAAIKAAPAAASNAATSESNSHIWAEGTDAQVQALGGVHSSKVWAEQSTNANISLTNSPYTTNRILEIPQDIKLELNDGTLTLKAGSKVYVPNGFEADGTTPKFDYMTLESDKVVGQAGTVTGAFALYRSDNGTCYSAPLLGISSGATAPSSPVTTVTWYDTTNNVIKVYNGTNWVSGVAFPLCIFSNSNSLVNSIDQVFNGFGYIGSTVFALPGVKVQTPNGRNEDGTYKSVIRTIDSVRTYDAGAWGTRNLKLIVSGEGLTFQGQPEEKFTYNKQFSSDTNTISYDENTGLWWYSSNQSSWVKDLVNIVGSCRVESGKITQFQVDTVDSVVNSNASNFSQSGRSYLSGLGMPSGRYIDLTVGADGSTYTAPANGWFIISGKPTVDAGYCIMDTNNYEPTYMTTNSNGWYDRGFIPVRKGQVMTLRYGNYEIEAHRFKFVYAEGEQNV